MPKFLKYLIWKIKDVHLAWRRSHYLPWWPFAYRSHEEHDKFFAFLEWLGDEGRTKEEVDAYWIRQKQAGRP